MGNPLWSKKAFLYFGGAFVILLGGAIILMAPYHYTGYVALQGDMDAFDIWAGTGYYDQLEISVLVTPQDEYTTVYVDIMIVNNATLEETPINMTLGFIDALNGTSYVVYERSVILDLEVGAYTIFYDRIQGASDMDVSLKQISDSRIFIEAGGWMNIIGLIMGALGYFVGGSVIPTGDEAIVQWGYDEHQKPK
jgi:hypothetical protein